MTERIIFAFLGHLIGDFIFQTKEMALRKSENGWKGFWFCTLHVLIYTTSVAVLTQNFSPLFLLSVSVPHWIIDRYSLASVWLKFIKGRTFDAAYTSTDKYREFDISFTSIVYTVVDNTFHILCLVGSLYLDIWLISKL